MQAISVISEWGQGQALRIPAEITRQLGFSTNDKVFLTVENDTLSITKVPGTLVAEPDAAPQETPVPMDRILAHPISQRLLGIAAGLDMSLEDIKQERLTKYE
jgi:antitoxin component of MazEF toxin-antitoxin module